MSKGYCINAYLLAFKHRIKRVNFSIANHLDSLTLLCSDMKELKMMDTDIFKMRMWRLLL